MPEATATRRRKLSVKTKLLFASGSLQEAVVSAGGIVTVLFYNQVLGVSPALAGTAFLIASIVDAISDPLIGAISDRFRSRWGRRHPFCLLALPIAISSIFFISQWKAYHKLATSFDLCSWYPSVCLKPFTSSRMTLWVLS